MNYFVLMMLNVSKQRSSDKNIVSHQIGFGTRDHELAIENNLQKRRYQLVCFFSSYRETAKSKAKKQGVFHVGIGKNQYRKTYNFTHGTYSRPLFGWKERPIRNLCELEPSQSDTHDPKTVLCLSLYRWICNFPSIGTLETQPHSLNVDSYQTQHYDPPN